MQSVLYETQKLVATTCYCGICYAVPEVLLAHVKETGAQIYCPAGHPGSYKETTAQKLEKQLAAERAKLDQAKSEIEWQKNRRAEVQRELDATHRKLTATRGVVTRTKNSIAKGKCPCCGKQFANLESHMLHSHPDYETTEEPTP